MRRVILLAIAFVFGLCLVALGKIIFDIEPMGKTEFMLLVFISAWCGDNSNEQSGKES